MIWTIKKSHKGCKQEKWVQKGHSSLQIIQIKDGCCNPNLKPNAGPVCTWFSQELSLWVHIPPVQRRHSLETNPRQRGGGWLLLGLSCHNAFHLPWHHFQAGQCKHLKTCHCKIFDGISKEGHFQQNLGLGKTDKSSGDENQRPCSASLTADTVRGPLPCMLSGWGRGSPHWTSSSIQQSAQPFNCSAKCYEAWLQRQGRLVEIQRIHPTGILKILATSVTSTVPLRKGENRKGEYATCLTGRRDPDRWNMPLHSFPILSLTNALADFLAKKANRHIQSTLSLARNVKPQNNQHFLFLKIFLMWPIFNVFIEFVTTLPPSYVFVLWLQGMWHPSSPTRDRICNPCIGRRSLNNWIARELPSSTHFYTLGPCGLFWLLTDCIIFLIN